MRAVVAQNARVDVWSREQLTGLLSRLTSEDAVPGIGIGMSLQGRKVSTALGLECVETGTSLQEGSRFQLGCLTKVLTAIVAAELIVCGTLDPDATAGEYIEELRGCPLGRVVRVSHLLSHTGGYSGLNLQDLAVTYGYSWQQFVAFLQATPLLFRPGSVFSYDHSEYVVVGEIIRRLTGLAVGVHFRERIFEPLGLHPGTIGGPGGVRDHALNRTTRAFERLAPFALGEFWSAALSDITLGLDDLLRVAAAIGTSQDNSAPFSRATRELLWRQVIRLPRLAGQDQVAEIVPESFGSGCAAYRGGLLGHNGSARGQTCALRFDPETGLALVVGMNCWRPQLRDRLVERVSPPRRSSESHVATEPPRIPIAEMPGLYCGPSGSQIKVSVTAGSLSCQVRFHRSKPPLQVELRLDDAGRVQATAALLHHALGFFREPATGRLGLFFGMVAYCKQ